MCEWVVELDSSELYNSLLNDKVNELILCITENKVCLF